MDMNFFMTVSVRYQKIKEGLDVHFGRKINTT